MEPQANRGPSILIVEDETLVRMGTAEHLRDAGFIAIEAANGEEARAVLEAGVRVDLVFSDITMPGLDGLALADWMGRMASPPPMILTSGVPSVLESARSKHAHVKALITKPYSYTELEHMVRELTPKRDDD